MVAVICMGVGITFGATAILIWQIVELKLATKKIIAEAQAALKASSESNQVVMQSVENLAVKVESLDFWRLQGSKK